MINVLFDPEAKKEFIESIRYYEGCQQRLGERFSQELKNATQQITKAPFRYRVLKSPFRRYLLQNFPFSIIYSIEPDHVRIIAVAHTKRKPGFWLPRLQQTH